MPNQPRPDNKPHMIRVDDALWEAVAAKAAKQGISTSEAIRLMCRRYVAR